MVIPLALSAAGMMALPTVAAVASLASNTMPTLVILKAFLKYGTVVLASTPSSTVLRNAQGRFSLATPGLDEACDVATTFISLATGNVTSAALLVSGPATAKTFSSPASLRSELAACAGLAPSSSTEILTFAPLMPPASLVCFSSIFNVTVLLRPHSANGPLLGTTAPISISGVCADAPTAAIDRSARPAIGPSSSDFHLTLDIGFFPSLLERSCGLSAPGFKNELNARGVPATPRYVHLDRLTK